jgi:hypothetical protein
VKHPAVGVVRALLRARSEFGRISILVDPSLNQPVIVEICRTAETFGFSQSESAELREISKGLPVIFRALSGAHAPDIPWRIYAAIGMAFRHRLDVRSAKRFYTLAFANASDPDDKATVLQSLALLASDEEARRILQNARSIAASGDGVVLAAILRHLGAVSLRLGEYAEGTTLLNQAGDLAGERGDTLGYVQARINIGAILLKQGLRNDAFGALDAIRDEVGGLGPAVEGAYHRLRSEVERGTADWSSNLPAHIIELLASAAEDQSRVPNVQYAMLAWRGDFEELVAAIVADDGPVAKWSLASRTWVAAFLCDEALARRSYRALAFAVVALSRWSKHTQARSHLPSWHPLGTELDRLRLAIARFVPSSPATMAMDAALLAQLHDLLGDAYRASIQSGESGLAAIHHWREALRLDEVIAEDPLGAVVSLARKAARSNQIGYLHYKIGTALNGFARNDLLAAEQAVRHLEIALEAYVDRPGETLHAEIRTNLSNALAYRARNSRGTGAGDDAAVADFQRSLELQREALGEVGHDYAPRIRALVNILQTYRDLAECDRDRGAWLDATVSTVREVRALLREAPELDRGLEAFCTGIEAEVTLDRSDAPMTDLLQLRQELLRLRPLVAESDPVLGLVILGLANLDNRLGQRARAYRRLVTEILRSQRAVDGLRGVGCEAFVDRLITLLVEWGAPQRAMYFANAQYALAWQRPVDPRRLLPARMGRPASNGDCAVILYISSDEATAFILTDNGVTPYTYDFRPFRAIPLLVERWLELFSNTKAPDWNSLMEEVATATGQVLFEPLMPLLPEAGRLTLVTGPILDMVPTALARANGRSVQERFVIRRGPYLDVWGEHAAEGSTEVDRIFLAAYSPPGGRLPFAAMEVRSIKAAVGAKATLVPEADSTADAVLRGIRDHRVVHVCCHGRWDWNEPLESSLQLADRPLTLREIALTLEKSPCELIVLSACESGMGRPERGGRGGFGHTFLGRGARAFIGALWRVDDLATALLFAKFYEEWTGNAAEASESLGLAQCWLRAEPGRWLAQRMRELLDQIEFADLEEQVLVQNRIREIESQRAPFADIRFWGGFQVLERVVVARH